jgi:hypothetical protein
MAERIRRTHEQRQAELERKLQRVKSERKKMESARRTRRAVILGTTIEAMAEAGDLEAKRAMDKVLAGLTRSQDRKMFDLEPLPDADADADPLAAALARRQAAILVWNDSDKSPADRVVVAEAMAACERLTGKCWEKMELKDRAGWGLSDRPGELLRAS